MCMLFNKDKEELTNIKKDIRTITYQSMYLSRQLAARPIKQSASSLIARDAIENLEVAMDLATPNAYTPPTGMVYTQPANTLNSVLAKYGLEKKWLGLDSMYKVPRWDYMQLLYLWDWTDMKTYVAEYGDCDKFAWIFKGHFIEFAMLNGIMFVIDYSGGHSYNLLFDLKAKEGDTRDNPIIDVSKSKLIVLEPQTDEWEEVPLVVAGQYTPSFSKWKESRRVAGLKSDMYPLKDCWLIM